MNTPRPTACPQCGARLQVIKRDPIESHGYDKPVRVDWDFQCAKNPEHETVAWLEYP